MSKNGGGGNWRTPVHLGLNSAPAGQYPLSVTSQPALVDHQTPLVPLQQPLVNRNPTTQHHNLFLVRVYVGVEGGGVRKNHFIRESPAPRSHCIHLTMNLHHCGLQYDARVVNRASRVCCLRAMRVQGST